MQDHRLPKQLLYGELSQGKRTAGGQKKRYKNAGCPDKCSISILKKRKIQNECFHIVHISITALGVITPAVLIQMYEAVTTKDSNPGRWCANILL
jgi:hypothetical protein